MLTLHSFFTNEQIVTEEALLDFVDHVSDFGDISQVQNHVTPEVFQLYIAAQTFGNWLESSWWGVICEQAELAPYIPAMLEAMQLQEIRLAFDGVIEYFPEHTIFNSDNDYYVDLVNYYQNARIKLSDEALNAIPKEQRQQDVHSMNQLKSKLEEQSEETFYRQFDDVWEVVQQYILKHL